jgi:rhamnulose-1-phosphate aldolase/alcohol dehydrogenase
MHNPFLPQAPEWDETHAAALNPLEQLVYRSNLLGADARVTNTGGGNTSSKIGERDPLSGEAVDVLWVKGSGGDLRTSGPANFASLEMPKLELLRRNYLADAGRGLKTSAEDAVVAMYPHATYGLNPRAPSIDTPLHAFVPYRHVDHTHPVAVIALAAARDGERLTHEVYGDEVVWVPWMRPGVELGLAIQRVCAEHPQAKGAVLGGHGLINWADDGRACYELSLRLIHQAAEFLARHDKGAHTFGGARYASLEQPQRRTLLAELLPWLRGRLAAPRRSIATLQDDDATLEFVNSADAARLAELGTSCPDHFLRTKIKPLYVEWDPAQGDLAQLKAALEAGIARYRADYAAYYEACRRAASPPMRDPSPTVVLLPGLGMLAWGKDKSESRVTAEFYRAAIGVMRGAESVSAYQALPRQEAFDIEYWLLEEAKLRRMPPEQQLARRVAVVIGAGSGIGRELAQRLSREGAQVVCADRDQATAGATAAAITDRLGMGIGVAGSDISGCGPALGLACDITDRASVRAMLGQAALAYGGIDDVVVTAGVFVAPDQDGRIPDERWAFTYAVNVTGSFLVADEAAPLWRAQGLSGSLVLTSSANAVVAKKGSLAYDTSKAAVSHLVRELAVELAPLVRVNGVAPATVVQGSAMFPRERVIASLAKYGIAFSEDEPTEALTAKLAQFYAQRTLLRTPITPADQAEAYLLLLGERLGRTTGQVITVDGGLTEAFLR